MNAKFNFVIPGDLLARVKEVAASKSISVAELINRLLVVHTEGINYEVLEKRISDLENEIKRLKIQK